jgi:hypothetical protein
MILMPCTLAFPLTRILEREHMGEGSVLYLKT